MFDVPRGHKALSPPNVNCYHLSLSLEATMIPSKGRILESYNSSCLVEVQAFDLKEGSDKTWAISYKVKTLERKH